MTQIKLRRDTSANFASKNPILGVGEPAYETDTKKLKIGDGTTAYNSLPYFSMTDEFATYREKYGAPSDSVPVINTGNSITIKANVSIETPNGTLNNTTDMTYTYDFNSDRVLFVTENDYYHAFAVYYGGREPSPVGEQIFWFNNNIWTMISGDGTKTVFNTQKITPIAKIYQVNGTVKNIDYSSYTKISAGGGGSTNITATLPLKIVDGVISLEVDGQTIQVVDGKLAASANMVTTNTAQTITGNKTFRYIGIDDAYGGKTRLGDGQSKIEMAYDGQISLDSATILADQSQNWRVGRYNKAGLIYSASPLKRVGDGPTFTNYDILDSSNLGSYVDGTTITYANNKLSASVSGLEVCDIGMALYVDETKGLRRYLNGQIVDINTNTQAFLNRLLEIKNTNPDYFTTEDNWQSEATLNVDGCVYKFVLNYSGDNVVSVRLPKYPDYVEINAGGTLPVVGNGMTLGLTDGNSTYSALAFNTADSLCPRSQVYGTKLPCYYPTAAGDFTNQSGVGIVQDPTKSGIQTTLKQTKLKLRYFIQIATGSETENNIINEIELNNPYSLFDSKYSDHELNNLSWLKSSGQWNAKAVYPTAYDKLLKVYNGTETVEGLSVKLSTEEYTDYDFVLNTAEETFRLPLLNGDEKFIDTSVVKILVNNWTLNTQYTAPVNCMMKVNTKTSKPGQFIEYYKNNVFQFNRISASSTEDSNDQIFLRKGETLKINTNYGGTKGAIKYSPAVGNGSLYYYVGETVQNANLIDAGRIEEQLATKTDMLQASGAGMPSNKYIDLTLGASGSTYTAPANGWFFIIGNFDNVKGYFSLINRENAIGRPLLGSEAKANGGSYSCFCWVPVKKGDKVLAYYNYSPFSSTASGTPFFMFVYAEGAK